MSIDMKSFMGEYAVESAVTPIVPQVPAATEQQADSNTYGSQDEYPFPDVPVENAPIEAEAPIPEPVKQEDPQERNFSALRAEVDRIKAEREVEKREHQLQIDMLRANRLPQQESPKPRKMFDGLEDTEVPNVGEIRRAWEEKEAAYESRLEELQVANRHSYYAEVIEKFCAPQIINDPDINQAFQSAKNKAAFAYKIGKLAQLQKAQEAPPPPVAQRSPIAQKIVENSRKPGNVATVGGQNTLSKVDYISNMSDAEFARYAAKNLGDI
jgi:hypothetical protein